MNRFNEIEFNEICKKLNSNRTIKDITIEYSRSGYFNRIKASVQRDRRGEVVFCVVRPNGKVVAITCNEYPKGTFRIPTGGIGHNEDILEAVHREVMEELGLNVSVKDFCGVLRIKFVYGSECEMFYSYVFILDEIGGMLLDDAIDDEVSEVREVSLDELEVIVEELGNIQGKWKDWGRFRHATSGAVLEFLREGNHLLQVTR